MAGETWPAARRVFEAALDRPTAERSRFVEAECAGDPALAGRVRRLLDANRKAIGFLERPAVADSLAEIAPLPPGRRVGAYRVIREIGRGGMGLVYLAERADEAFRKQVALKLVRPGVLDPEIIARLCEERRILARLEHPNIARLLDGGSTEGGLPYLVMEYVAGEPIDRHCRRLRRSVEERIRLFREVCSAVHFAHQNLIIHRDLKPSNVLVAEGGEVKLLDFGLARLTAEADAKATDAGERSVRAMTPAYASPEQIRGEALTTATDVYSLGVLLYELLTGRRPHPAPDDGSGALERAILEETPAPPSEAVPAPPGAGGSDGAGPPVASAGSRARDDARAARRWSRRLRGDLDRIVLTALAKRPADRYRSVERLADDLGRHLELLPVAVRRPTLRYRAGRFARRHAAAVTVGAAASAVLLAASATLAVQHRRIVEEKNAVALERTRAETVEAFTVELFEQFDPEGGRPEYARFREELLDANVRRIETELRDQPAVRADLMTTIGTTYRRMARYDRALAMLHGGLALRRASLGDERPEVAESFHELGVLRAEQGRFALAEALLGHALTMRRHLLGDAHPAIAESLHSLGSLRHDRGDYAAADALLREALAMRRRLLGNGHPRVAETSKELAMLTWDRGGIDEAERLWREALAIDRRRLGSGHPAVADGVEALALLAATRGDPAAAEPLYREALEMRRLLLGDDHPSIARNLYSLAYLDELRGDSESAERGYRRVLAMNRKILGDQHLDVAGSLNALGRVRQAQGDYAGAETLLRQALEMNRRLAGEEHRHVAASHLHLADLAAERGEPHAAERLYRQGLALGARAFGADHWVVVRGSYRFAAVLAADGRASEGEAMAREALRRLERALPGGHWRIAEARSVLGGCLISLGRYAEAEPLVVESHPRIVAALGARSRAGREAAARIDRLYARWNRSPPVMVSD